MQAVSFHELIAATGGNPVGVENLHHRIARIEIDSRRVRHGDVFWALRGDRLDGHKFVKQALQQGAIASVVQAGQSDRVPAPKLEVDDTLAALWRFANWYRRQFEVLVIGVTGSVGKTTTRRMIAAVLSARFRGVQSPQNFNNRFGVPLSLLEIGPQDEFAVIELAASQVGEIAGLAAVAEPEVGALTAIGPAHLDEFGSIDNIVRTKCELLEALPATGFAILNGDDKWIKEQIARSRCRVILVGEHERNDCRATNIVLSNGRLAFNVGTTAFEVPAVGRQHLYPALTAIVIARQFEMSDAEIAQGLKSFQSVAGRAHPRRIGDWWVIDDTYNANPLSMAAACHALRDWDTTGKRVLVAGDMLSLGDWSGDFHRLFGEEVAKAKIDQLIAVGSQAAVVAGSAHKYGMDAGCLGVCRDQDLALLLLDCWLEPGDVVWVKGSRGMKMEHLVDSLQRLADRRGQQVGERKAA